MLRFACSSSFIQPCAALAVFDRLERAPQPSYASVGAVIADDGSYNDGDDNDDLAGMSIDELLGGAAGGDLRKQAAIVQRLKLAADLDRADKVSNESLIPW